MARLHPGCLRAEGAGPASSMLIHCLWKSKSIGRLRHNGANGCAGIQHVWGSGD